MGFQLTGIRSSKIIFILHSKIIFIIYFKKLFLPILTHYYTIYLTSHILYFTSYLILFISLSLSSKPTNPHNQPQKLNHQPPQLALAIVTTKMTQPSHINPQPTKWPTKSQPIKRLTIVQLSTNVDPPHRCHQHWSIYKTNIEKGTNNQPPIATTNIEPTKTNYCQLKSQPKTQPIDLIANPPPPKIASKREKRGSKERWWIKKRVFEFTTDL